MRLIHIFNNETEARSFSGYLTKASIENLLEVSTITDWGNPDYGTVQGKLWIIDEDQVDNARQSLELFLQNPKDAQFEIKNNLPGTLLKPFLSEEVAAPAEPKMKVKTVGIRVPSKPTGIVTFYILMTCVLLFLLVQFTSISPKPFPSGLPWMPLFSSPLEKELLYDYPAAYEILDKIISAYGLDQLLDPENLSAEGKHLLQQFHQTPFWQGLYAKIVNYLSPLHYAIRFDAPMFEKIRQGEIWRLFTPALLHNDIFHILFNMIWLVMLGRQIEQRIGAIRFLIFVILTGIFSNTAQYLMTGPDFIGFSGVLCAMITFVWFRQKRTPWEGYQLQPATMGFITVFILAIVALQIISFLLEISGHKNMFSINIANTAHLSGALAGIFLSYLNLFARQTRS